METESSLPYSQAPATCPYWANSIQSPQPLPTSSKSTLILSSHLRLGLPNGLFPSGFPTKTLMMHDTHNVKHKITFSVLNNNNTVSMVHPAYQFAVISTC